MIKIVIKIILLPLILIGIGIIFCEINKAYWDHQVKLMCKKDGGVTIFEKVEISKSDYPEMKFISSGMPILPFKDKAKLSDPFYLSTDSTEFLREGSPEIMRFKQSIIRSSDSKELSRHISYGRRGGDFPTGISHPSSFVCGSDESDYKLLNSVISVNE